MLPGFAMNSLYGGSGWLGPPHCEPGHFQYFPMKRRVVKVPFLRKLAVPDFLSILALSIPVFRIMPRWSVRIAADGACPRA